MKIYYIALLIFSQSLVFSQTDSYLGKENQYLSGQLIGSKKIRFVDYPYNGSYSHSGKWDGSNKQVSSSEDASIISVTHGGSPHVSYGLNHHLSNSAL